MNGRRILVTGSEGLIGHALVARLLLRGHQVSCLDLRARDPASRGDVRDPLTLRRALASVDLVVHLAAVSRVACAERDPELCLQTNVIAFRRLLHEIRACPHNPALLFGSSREVHGQPATLPVTEDTAIHPLNTYGHSKAEGERLVAQAMATGLRASVVRFSNVYGARADHPDRLVPALVQAALKGAPLHLNGPDHTCDLTHVNDVVEGLVRAIDVLCANHRTLPTLQLVSGLPVSLAELAAHVLRLTGSRSAIHSAPSRRFDVAHFHGDPALARQLLGWRATISLDEGLRRLIQAHRSSPISG